MLRFTLLILMSGIWVGAFAQADTGMVKIHEDPRVMLLNGKWKEVQERTDGKTEGWRVKIHFSSDREKAKSVRVGFLSKYPNVPAYEDYNQPLFVVLVGDFRTRMEAYKFLQEIKGDYPGAFIVQEEIELPAIELAKPESPENTPEPLKPGNGK